ncbi:MAG: twin-arginine translocation signal domain-containing protein [Planctomycetes bacterium]|nr:twin-arginine translocation signal domain-containing protein [Planctomycetota bacterium]
MCDDLTRRGFLKGSGVALLSLPLLSSLSFAKRSYGTRHIVLVAFAGGVRSRETIETPANIPNLMRIAQEGVICPNINVMNNGHFGATMSIFTGKTEYAGIRENERGENPTLFEYVRKGKELSAETVWLSTSGGAQQRNLVYSAHKDYGEEFGANLIDADGVFNTEFQKVISSFGTPSVPSEAEEDAIAKLRAAMAPPPPVSTGLANDPATIERLQKYILEEISGKTARITGPGASDARAIAVASPSCASSGRRSWGSCCRTPTSPTAPTTATWRSSAAPTSSSEGSGTRSRPTRSCGRARR